MGSGIKQSSIDHRSRLRASKPLFVVVGVITLFLIYLSVAAVRHSKERVPEKLDQVVSVPASITPPPIVVSDKSVAVLPFVDMSEKKDQEYFSDGLSEELIDMLTKVAELRVPARTSSFYFKGKSEDISTIAKRLLVAHVLEGSVRKSGNQMRITVQLVRADSGYHLWSQTYDRKVDDVFRVQDEIAAAVVKALKVSLLEASPPQAAPTSSTEAYLTYLKGSAHFRRSTPMDYEESVVLLKQALKLDPNYAPAWGLLARALRAQVIDGHATYADLSKPIRAAASRAVDLDPNLSDAYVALASSYLIDWQWDEVDIALKKALELQPGNPLALKYASFLATSRGQTDLALRFAEDALARDPLDYSLGANLVSANEDAGRYEEAEARFRLDLALNPTQPYVHSSISWFKFMQGNPAAALDEIEQEPDESNRLSGRVIYLDALGRHAEADAALALYTKKYASTNPFTVASLNARRGNGDQAFEWLERAYRLHDDNVADLHNSTGFKNLRADPRYKAMRRKMHLPE
jgi:TolB-like protein/tetratricopeptide (TPR) repeat protein